MISYKNMRLAPKIVLPVSLMLIVCLGTLAWIIQDRSSSVINTIAHKELNSLAGRYAADVQGFIEISLNESTSLAHILQDAVQDKTGLTREEAVSLFQGVVKNNDLFVGGGCVWLPNAFDGKDAEYATDERYKPDGRFSLYVVKSNGRLSQTSLSDEGEYYQGPKRTGKPYVANPYDYDLNGQKVPMVTGSVPILLNGSFVGMACMDITVEAMTKRLNSVHLYKRGFISLLNSEGLVITHPEASRVNVNLFQDPKVKIADPGALKQAMRDGRTYNDVRVIKGEKMFCYYQPVTFRNTGISWYLLVTAPVDEVLASATSLSWLTVSLCLGVLALVLLSVALVARFTAQPIVQLAAAAQEVASGNYKAKITTPIPGDEVGQLRTSLRTMITSLLKTLSEAEAMKKSAEQQATNAKEAMTMAEAAGQEARTKSEAMLKVADRLEEVAGIVSSASAELSAQIDQSEHGASEQADRVTETVTAMEEMTSTVEEVARNAGKASDISLQTRQEASEGAKVVNHVVASIQQVQQKSLALREDMNALSEHAQSITQIMGVISDIADQTNLLALNAAIEAARAGEAGRGFAVVADEVRKLAEKTMASTTDVGNAIKAIQESARKSMEQVDRAVLAIDEATGLATQSGEALHRIVSMAESTADQVRTIATASEQQAASSEEINKSITQVSTIAGKTVTAMGEAARAVTDLAGQAQSLSSLIDDMKRH